MPMFFLRTLGLFVLACALTGCAKGGVPATPDNVSLTEGIPYCTGAVDGVQQPLLLDVARPKDQKKSLPVVLVVHGGGWTDGSRADYTYMLNWLAQQNFIGVSVDYRLSPKNKFPDQLEDLKCAVRWLRANEVLYRFDARRIVAIGASAGAHLVALLGTTAGMSQFEGIGGSPNQSSSIDAMVLHAGVYDLSSLVRELAVNPSSESHGGIQAVSMLLGGNNDPTSKAYAIASPASYVSKQTVPALLLHGRNDSLVPFNEALRFGSLLTGLGLDNEVVIMNGAGHGDFGSDPGLVIMKLLNFLNAQTQQR